MSRRTPRVSGSTRRRIARLLDRTTGGPRAVHPTEADDEERGGDGSIQEQLGATQVAHAAIVAVAAARVAHDSERKRHGVVTIRQRPPTTLAPRCASAAHFCGLWAPTNAQRPLSGRGSRIPPAVLPR